ncbi:MAG TPA: hypothetical protein VGS20_08505 [Candidatus Acidoferrales bacterium]|nr:hypothetical protein [Candidatus Acidoferrales bacterium]
MRLVVVDCLGVVLALLAGLWPPAALHAQQPKTEPFDALNYRYIGPPGNRVVAVAGVPGNPDLIYAGAANGGIWKSTDGGVHWKPIFDGQEVQSIGALAVAPSDSNVVWAGTGEAFIRGNISIGNGVDKSTDGGKTWTHMGLDGTGRIARLVIDPRNPDVVYAAALGTCYGPQQERGVYRTGDGGKTWQRVLFVDENTGAADIAMSPSNPSILFAAMWQVLIRPWDLHSGGPGSGIYMSRDGGTTWKHLTGNGLPAPPLGRIGLAVAPSEPSRVYALIETADRKGVLWRSDDEGENWTVVSRDTTLNLRPHYFSRLAVMPDNPNEVWFATIMTPHVTYDGGRTAKAVRAVWPDNHDIWIDPLNPNRLMVSNDRYVNISTDRGRSWMRSALPIAQIYHVAADDRIPYFVYGNRQDGPAYRCPSNSQDGTQILPADCTWTGGAESGWTLPDPADPNMVWTSGMGGFLQHFDVRTGFARDVNPWPESGWPAANQKYRFQWTYPLALSPQHPHRVYMGSQYVMESGDDGQTWKEISPDLTLNDKSKQQSSGGLSPDNTGVEVFDVVFAIAESPLQDGLIWAGTNDGLVQVTQNGGGAWTNVTKNIPNLLPYGNVTSIEPSHFSAGTAFVTIDRHQMDDRNPYVYMTADYGATWKSIAADLPRGTFSYAACIREDPVRKGLLYLGTENAIFASFDDGDHWIPLQQNLPHTRVSWITVQLHFDDLVLATYGRGIWVLDDIGPLQQLTDAVRSSKAYLFTLRPAYRFLTKPTLPIYMGEETDPPTLAGQNPTYGADINYYFGSAPKDEVQIQIADASGHVIRTLKGTKKQGINRVWWDLKYEGSRRPHLETEKPEEAASPSQASPPEENGLLAPPVAPGTYTVKMKVGTTDLSRPLNVLKDPQSSGTQQGILAQTKMELDLRDTLNAMTSVIDQIETVRSQILALEPVLKGEARWKPLEAEGEALGGKLRAVEEALYGSHISNGSESGSFYYPPSLYSKVSYLAVIVASADDFGPNQVADDSGPTAGEQALYALYAKQMAEQKATFEQLVTKDLAEFNAKLRDAGVAHVSVVPAEK